jgi:mannose-6-phosphate isomerase-like protein (cupin superfamily)
VHGKAFVLRPGENRGPSDGAWSTRLTGVDTGGLVSIGQADMPPMSSGPSLHVHTNEDEASVVVEGVLTVQLGDERFDVPAGGLVWLARGVPHTFANLTTCQVKVIGLITPAGLEGMFEDIGAYLQTLAGPPDPARIAQIGERYGVKSVGPPIDVSSAEAE